MDGGRSSISSGGSSYNTINHDSSAGEEEDQKMMMLMMEDLRRGPWTVEEDLTLMNYIANHGEGRWNSLARCAGLKRTGKSCRLRWLNYLRPDVRRGNITLEEQLLILELHSRWGNRWSKIAQHLPGRTDNEIKNYWRTRVQKHAKQLKCDVNSKQFKDTMKYLWMPRLVERIQAASSATTIAGEYSGHPLIHNNNLELNQQGVAHGITDYAVVSQLNYTNDHHLHQNSINSINTINTTTPISSDAFGAQVSPVSDITDNYNNFPVNYGNTNNMDYFQGGGYSTDTLNSPCGYYNNGHGIEFQSTDQNSQWFGDNEGISDNLWNDEDIWLLQQQFNNNI